MTKKKFVASAIAFSLLSGCLIALPSPMPAYAAEHPQAAAAAAKGETDMERQFVKLSENGFTALQDMHAARLAIFNGNPDGAKKLLDDAKTALAAARKEAMQLRAENDARMAATAESGGKAKSSASTAESAASPILVPVDARMTIADDFVVTPEKRAHIERANQHLRTGDTRRAVEELRQGDIHVSIAKIMMPIDSTENNLDTSIKLIGDQKYYEANLALKGAEDGLFVETERFVETPPPAPAPHAAK